MNDYQLLKLASLFHDIGKFHWRADNFVKFSHAYDDKYEKLDKLDCGSLNAYAKLSADFTKEYFNELVEELAAYHQNPKKSCYEKLCKLLQKVNHQSSEESIKSIEEQELLVTPLTSIFSRISLNDKSNEEYYVPINELDFTKDLYPKNEKEMSEWNLVKDYEKLWYKFVKEFKLLKTMDFESVLELVKKYTSTIPSSVYKSESDISFYDSLKTTTAIRNCRYLYSQINYSKISKNKDFYRIINGDISGIQKFIYRVNSPEDAQNGMSKRLRGRSLYLTLLCESITNKIIYDLNLDSTNILFCGGGRFTIIAPNTQKTLDVIHQIDNDVNAFFINQFNAELYLALVSTSCDGDGLDNFEKILLILSNLLSENKKHKFVKLLDKLFDLEDEVNYHLCSVCGNKSLENKLCNECYNHEELGKKVANSKYLIKYVSDVELSGSDFFIDFLNTGYIFKSRKEAINLVNNNLDIKFTIYKLNDANFLDLIGDIINENVSFGFKVLGNNVPTIKEKPLYFNHLAQLSKGANKLGVLKIDVDNLGLIFSKGFNNLCNDSEGTNISHISSLSFYMDLFFSGCINQIIHKFKFFTQTYGHSELFDEIELEFKEGVEKVYRSKKELPNEFKDLGHSTIYINYSGGDDLLVVGPYDDIIEFAYEFRSKFKNWTAYNDSINISGGIFISSPKFPIGKSAIMANKELEKSKDCGRNKFTVFNEVLKWESNNDKIKGFDELFVFGKFLEDLKESDKISSGFIYSLLYIWNSSFKFNKLTVFDKKNWEEYNKRKISSYRYIPLLMYKLRNIPKKEKERLAADGKKFMPWIKIPVSWASLRLR